MKDVFDLEADTLVHQNDSYILSYPHILSYFSAKTTFNAADMVRGAHMVYGWMPTILDLYPEAPNRDLAAGAALLTEAKCTGALADQKLDLLAKLVNNSLVGASKLLHFVAPDQFAIWDSKIYAFVFEQKPNNGRVNKVANYREYLRMLSHIQSDSRFDAFHDSVNGKIGYKVSPLRAIELVMFLNAKKQLLEVAEGYEHIARITPSNPSAAGRAAQLREIAKLLD